MRFHANLDLREYLSQGQWQDAFTVIRSALERDTQQFRRDENMAMLLDRWDFYLDARYSEWITDPTDETVKAEARRRKEAGIKPPPQPLLFPVALRAPDVTEIYMQRYTEAAQRYSKPAEDSRMTLAQVLAMRKR